MQIILIVTAARRERIPSAQMKYKKTTGERQNLIARRVIRPSTDVCLFGPVLVSKTMHDSTLYTGGSWPFVEHGP